MGRKNLIRCLKINEYKIKTKDGILFNKKLFNKNDIKKMEFSKKITKNDLSKKSFVEGFFSSLKSKMYGRK